MSAGTRRDWSSEEDEFLREHYTKKGARWVADRLRRSAGAVEQHAARLHIQARFLWTDEEDALLRKLWPKLGKKCAHRFPGRTYGAVSNRAQMLGVRAKKKAEVKGVGRIRNRQTSYGYIPGGPAPSVFHLAQKAQP